MFDVLYDRAFLVYHLSTTIAPPFRKSWIRHCSAYQCELFLQPVDATLPAFFFVFNFNPDETLSVRLSWYLRLPPL